MNDLQLVVTALSLAVMGCVQVGLAVVLFRRGDRLRTTDVALREDLKKRLWVPYPARRSVAFARGLRAAIAYGLR